MKTCRKCNLDKEDIEFYKHKRTCKLCCNTKDKQWRLDNPQSVKITSHNTYLRNKDARKAPRKIYALNRRKSDKTFALRSAISATIRRSIYQKGYIKTQKTIDILGCSIIEFKNYLESKFETWMSWENYGSYNGELNFGWDIDHILPISKARDEKEVISLNHYSNLQPLCSKINRDIKRDN